MFRGHRRRRLWRGLAIAAVVGLITLPTVWYAYQVTHPSGPSLPVGIPVNATVELGGYLGTHLASPFYAVVFGDDGTPTHELVAMGAFFNSTPLTWFRFGGNGSSYDPTTQTYYSAPPGGGAYQASRVQVWNLTWFKSWCLSRDPACDWLGYLPAEENNTSSAVAAANWYHTQLGFAPTDWELGNEPTSWTHYGIPLADWSTTDDSVPSNLGYAEMVREYIAAVSASYPADRFVGLEASCGCDASQTEETASLDGPVVAAMSYHSYPSLPGSSTSLSAFYGALEGSASLPSENSRFTNSVLTGCPSCAGLPIQVGEYQSGPAPALSPLLATYAGAPFLAASITQALASNVSMFTVFDSGSLFDPALGSPSFEGLLYQRILNNMTMGADYAAPITTPGVGGLFSVIIHNGSRASLLVVNTNQTYALNLTVPAAAFPTPLTRTLWSWAPGEAVPEVARGMGQLSAVRIPPQGICLIDDY